MNLLWNALAGIASGLIGSMGLGGGGVLVLYLVLVLNMNQVEAQGINLIFFIPIAIVSLVIHSKNHLIQWKKAIPLILTGLLGVGIGTFVLGKIDPTILRKIFAVFLFIIGAHELLTIKKKTAHPKKDPPHTKKTD